MSEPAIVEFEPPAPTPLIPDRSAPLPYPVDALGPVLAGFVRFTVEATRCAEPTAAQSGLAVACLAAQAHADVVTPAGKTAPLSLYFLTIALTGERKTAADDCALTPVRQVQDEDRETWRREHLAWRNHSDAWQAQRNGVMRDRKSSMEGKNNALGELGPEPLPPLRPERTVEDVTAEGLIKSWTDCHASRGLFTSEGAKVIDGHSMSDEARRRTAAAYSGLWDNGRADRVRAGDGHLSLRGKRLAVHLMAQPGVAAAFMNAPDLTDQGLIGRFVICEAPEQAGTRFFRAPPSRQDLRFRHYCDAIERLLRLPLRTLDGRNELDPPALTFTPDAREVWCKLHDHFEARLGSAGELGGVKSFGNKLAEHAARLAGVLTILETPDARVIKAETMLRVCELAHFYASEAERLNAESRIARPLAEAEKLRVWLVDVWPERLISVPDAMQLGPNALRAKAAVERCFALLQDHGWLIAAGPGVLAGKRRQETFAVIGGRASP